MVIASERFSGDHRDKRFLKKPLGEFKGVDTGLARVDEKIKSPARFEEFVLLESGGELFGETLSCINEAVHCGPLGGGEFRIYLP